MPKYLLILGLIYGKLMAQPPAAPLYPVIWKWAWGHADSSYRYTSANYPRMIGNLQNAYQIKRAREFWYNKNLKVFQMGHNRWLRVDSFLGRFQTIRGFIRAGSDMVEQSIGGFTVHILPKGSDSLHFTVYDVKSRWSFFWHLPFVGNRPYEAGRHRQKLMADVKWYFEWTEPIKSALFQRRILNMQLYPAKKYTGVGF